MALTPLLRAYTASLPTPHNYPRIARLFLHFCLQHALPLCEASLRTWIAQEAHTSKSLVSAVRKLLRFCQQRGVDYVRADVGLEAYKPPTKSLRGAAANELVLRFLAEAGSLRGAHSKATYQTGLHSFFDFMEAQNRVHPEAAGRGSPPTERGPTERGPGRSAAGAPAARFDARTVEVWVSDLRTRGRSTFTINSYLTAVRQMARWLTRHHDQLTDAEGKPLLTLQAAQVKDLQRIDEVALLKMPAAFYKDALTEPELETLLDAAQDRPKLALAVALMGYCGLRSIEVVRLRVQDVSLHNDQADQGRLWVRGKGKGYRQQIALIGPTASYLRRYLDREGRSLSPTQPLFKLTIRQLRYHLDKLLLDTGLKTPRITVHSLRHTAGQLLLQKGIEPVYVQRQLRHENLKTTQQYIGQQMEKVYFQVIHQASSASSTNP